MHGDGAGAWGNVVNHGEIVCWSGFQQGTCWWLSFGRLLKDFRSVTRYACFSVAMGTHDYCSGFLVAAQQHASS